MTDTTYTRPGSPGASAQRAYEALARRAEPWAVGAAGERAVARRLGRCRRAVVLSDRAWPGRRANLDHLAVAPAGIFVIDTKAHAGRVELVDRGGFLQPSLRLFVAGWDRSDLVAGVARQARLVGDIVGRACPDAAAAVVPVLCFVGAEWALPTGCVGLGEVVVAEAGAIRRVVGRRGPLGAADRSRLARMLDAALPPR